MKVLRAGLIGIVLWVIIFFEVSILMFGFKLEGISYYIIHYIFLVFIAIFGGLWYFKKSNLKKGFGYGLVVGIIFVIIGMILDSVLTIPFFILPQGGSYTSFLFEPYLLIGELILIVVTGIIGGLKKK